ncbi:MAG TPA: hypothetical protein VGM50_12005 [Gemmatimonadaceae bacterium]|jgi:hypothetical protein
MEDEVLRYHAGPKDGEIVELPPEWGATRLADLESVILPSSIRLVDGGIYLFDPEHKRFEWRG